MALLVSLKLRKYVKVGKAISVNCCVKRAPQRKVTYQQHKMSLKVSDFTGIIIDG